MISKTKLDDSFPARQLLIDGYTSPDTLDKNGKDGGILANVREDIRSKQFHFTSSMKRVVLKNKS